MGNEQQQEQQQQQRDASGPAAHLDSLTTATGFTSFGDDLTSLNTSEMPSMPRQKNHQERAGSPVKTSLSLICWDWPNPKFVNFVVVVQLIHRFSKTSCTATRKSTNLRNLAHLPLIFREHASLKWEKESGRNEISLEPFPQFVFPLSQAKGNGDGINTANPERVFKVIFIGDSSVGKTSLIRRFCRGAYAPEGLRSTIGVDFHTRSLLVERQTVVCLQCWDTAGQERYRAITAQYFRKSDAV